MKNPFGPQLKFSPIPATIHLELKGREKSGKSTFVAQWVKPGLVAVVDADGRFSDVVPEESQAQFFQISTKKSDMVDVDRIVHILADARPQVEGQMSAIVIDTLTKILDPIIAKIQDAAYTTVYSYREKADAMKKLRNALNLYGCETVWVYHRKLYYKEAAGEGKKKEYVLAERDSIGITEYARLGADITLSLEIVVDEKTGKRGAKVNEARKGRTGFIYWDESGNWSDVRANLEAAIWGGLTKEEQDAMEDDKNVVFSDAKQAVRWAWKYSENHGKFFDDAAHAENAYKELKRNLGTQYDKLTAEIVFDAWKVEVFRREEEKKEGNNG